MFKRDILGEFKQWAARRNRKPLILRGARQVGKTTAVEMFSSGFDQFLSFNLEKKEDRKVFENEYPFRDLLSAMFLSRNKLRSGGKTLIFIDEIQNSPKAVSLLRYFYEDASDLYVIASGSLLETVLSRKIAFPVGRVEFMVMHPCSFREYLVALNENENLKNLEKDSVPEYAHDSLLASFRKYATIGGMPQVLNEYSADRDITSLSRVYEALLLSYYDDVEKYAKTALQARMIQHIIGNAFHEASERITFDKFGNSPYRSREMKDAFLALEKTFLLNLVYPLTRTDFPLKPDLRKKPRLHLVDTGLVNFSSGMMGEMVFSQDIHDVYRGKIAEHIVGQELISASYSAMYRLNFWVRDKKESAAEVDYVFPFKGLLIPVEVKAGHAGKLRSLHQFMDAAPHRMAVRVWQGKQSVESARTLAGKEFTLLNLPLYLVHRIEKELHKQFRKQ